LLNDYRGIPSQARYIIVGTFFSQLAVGLIFTDLAYFLTTIRALPATFAGLLFTIEGLTSVALSIPVGVLSDRYGRKKFVVAGNLVVSLSVATLSISSNLFVLASAAMFAGVSEASFTGSTGALLAEKAGDSRRTSVFSLAALVSNAAFGLGGFVLLLIGPITSFGLSTAQAHVILYLVLAVLSLLSTPLLFKIEEKRYGSVRAGEFRIVSKTSRSILSKYIVANIFVATGAGLVVPLMSQWFAYRYGIPDSVSGSILGISNLLLAGATLAAPAAAKRFGVVRSIVLTEGLSTIFMFATPLPPSYAVSGSIYIVRAFLMNVSAPLSQSLIIGMVPERERGAASGISAAFWRMPNALSSYPGSALMKDGHLQLPFFMASGLYVASISLFWYWFRKARLPEEPAER
jgi:MFS family permease